MIAVPVFAQERMSFGDVLDVITNARTYEDKKPWSNRKINRVVSRIVDQNPEYITQVLSFNPNGIGSTLLETAAERGNVPLIHSLMERGADLNMEKQFPPLISAARGHSPEAVKCLINEYGADINVRNPFSGSTPLIAAADFLPMQSYQDDTPENKIENALTALLEYPNVDINATDNSNKNAASYVLRHIYNSGAGCRECVLNFKKLLQKGAKKDATINPTDPEIIKILKVEQFKTLLQDDRELKELLFVYLFDIDYFDEAIMQEGLSKDYFKNLIDKNTTELQNITRRIMEISNSRQNTPLPSIQPPASYTVCEPITYDYERSDEFGYMLRLISKYALDDTEIDEDDIWVHVFNKINKHPEYVNMIKDHKNILTAAGSAGAVKYLKFIERNNGLPKDANGRTIHTVIDQQGAISPLISNAYTGKGDNHVQATIFLLSHGANVNAQHPENLCTPLMYSIIYDNVEITLKLLQKRNIDLEAKSSENKTALRYAFDKGCLFRSKNTKEVYDICQELMNKNAKPDDYMAEHPAFIEYMAATPIDTQIVKKIVSHKKYTPAF